MRDDSISEISPPDERGMLMSGYQTILQLSALVGFWGAYASNSLFLDSSPLQYKLPIAVQLVPGVLLFFTLFIPETPRFLAEKGRVDEAETSLAWLRGVGEEEWKVAEEMEEVLEAARVSKVMKARKESFLKEIIKKGIRERLLVGVGLMIAQNMVGLNALNYCESGLFYILALVFCTILIRWNRRTSDIHVSRIHVRLIESILDWSLRCR